MRACVYSLKRERERKKYLIWKIKFNKKKLGKTRMWNFTRLHRDEVCVCVMHKNEKKILNSVLAGLTGRLNGLIEH